MAHPLELGGSSSAGWKFHRYPWTAYAAFEDERITPGELGLTAVSSTLGIDLRKFATVVKNLERQVKDEPGFHLTDKQAAMQYMLAIGMGIVLGIVKPPEEKNSEYLISRYKAAVAAMKFPAEGSFMSKTLTTIKAAIRQLIFVPGFVTEVTEYVLTQQPSTEVAKHVMEQAKMVYSFYGIRGYEMASRMIDEGTCGVFLLEDVLEEAERFVSLRVELVKHFGQDKIPFMKLLDEGAAKQVERSHYPHLYMASFLWAQARGHLTDKFVVDDKKQKLKVSEKQMRAYTQIKITPPLVDAAEISERVHAIGLKISDDTIQKVYHKVNKKRKKKQKKSKKKKRKRTHTSENVGDAEMESESSSSGSSSESEYEYPL